MTLWDNEFFGTIDYRSDTDAREDARASTSRCRRRYGATGIDECVPLANWGQPNDWLLYDPRGTHPRRRARLRADAQRRPVPARRGRGPLERIERSRATSSAPTDRGRCASLWSDALLASSFALSSPVCPLLKSSGGSYPRAGAPPFGISRSAGSMVALISLGVGVLMKLSSVGGETHRRSTRRAARTGIVAQSAACISS